MKRRLCVLCLTALLTLLLVLPASATAKDGRCGCGREYAVTDGDGYMAFDCLGCGRNYTSCSCKTCWCGAGIERTYHEDGTIDITRCLGCGLPCEECICRDRSYYDALLSLKNGVSGTEVPHASNGIVVVLAALLPFAVFCGIYAWCLLRRTVSDAGGRSAASARVKGLMDRIDREPDPKLRYALAKARSQGAGATPPSPWEAEAFARRKNELLPNALDDDLVRETAEADGAVCRAMNEKGLFGLPERIGRRWDADRREISFKEGLSLASMGETTVKWDTSVGQIALFEAVTPLNGNEENRLPAASNVTRFCAAIGDRTIGDLPENDAESEAELRAALARLVPGANIDLLMTLPQKEGEKPRLTGLPPVPTSRRVGDKNRFPGGIKG